MKLKTRNYYNFAYDAISYYDLSRNDELILDYILSFALSGKAYTMDLYDHGIKRRYYWIKYDALITAYNGVNNERHILDITRTDVLGRKIKELTEKGIIYYRLLNKRNTPEGRHERGNYTYIAIDTDAMRFLMGGDSPYLARSVENSIQDIDTLAERENNTRDIGNQTGCTAGKDTDIAGQSGSSSTVQSMTIDMIQAEQPDTTKSTDSCTEESVPCISGDTHPVDSQVNTKTIYSEDNEFKRPWDIDETATPIASMLAKILSKLGGVYKDFLTERTVASCVANGFTSSEDICAYLDYIYHNMESNKDIRNRPSYFIKAATGCAYGKAFLERKNQKISSSSTKSVNSDPARSSGCKREDTDMHDRGPDVILVRPTHECPVCGGTYSDEAGICTTCGLKDENDAKDLAIARATFALDEESRKEMLYRLNRNTLSMLWFYDKAKAMAERQSIYAEYGIKT